MPDWQIREQLQKHLWDSLWKVGPPFQVQVQDQIKGRLLKELEWPLGWVLLRKLTRSIIKQCLSLNDE